MTDYLEQAMGNASALWEDRQRLDQSQTAGRAVRPDGTAEGPASMADRAAANWLWEGRTLAAPEAAVMVERTGTPLDAAAPDAAVLPLLEQVERVGRLVRAGQSVAAQPMESASHSWRWSGLGGAPAAERTALSPTDRAQSLWEQDRAEQVDRAFRRDSRRYDGGFFLY